MNPPGISVLLAEQKQSGSLQTSGSQASARLGSVRGPHRFSSLPSAQCGSSSQNSSFLTQTPSPQARYPSSQSGSLVLNRGRASFGLALVTVLDCISPFTGLLVQVEGQPRRTPESLEASLAASHNIPTMPGSSHQTEKFSRILILAESVLNVVFVNLPPVPLQKNLTLINYLHASLDKGTREGQKQHR